MYSTLFALAMLGAALWLWRDSLRAREQAARVSRRACDAESVQFLDDTVALAGLRPVLEHGRPVLRRVYQFEFSRRGVDRQVGSVMLTGERLDTIYLTPDPSNAPDPTQDGDTSRGNGHDAAAGTVVPFEDPKRRH